MLADENGGITYFNSESTNIVPESALNFAQNITLNLDSSIVNFVAALAIILLGFLVSAIAAYVTKNILKRIDLDELIAAQFQRDSSELESFQIEYWVPIAVFYAFFGITIITFLEILNFTQFTAPFNAFLTDIYGYLPGLGATAILFIVAWLLANGLRLAAGRCIDFLKIDERLNNSIEDYHQENRFSLGHIIPQALYWLVLLFFVPVILDNLGLQSALEPIEQLLEEFLAYLPNILGAILIGVFGWFSSKTVGKIVSSFCISVGVDRLGVKIGIDANRKGSLSWLGGTFVSVVILIYTAIAIFNQLNIEAISEPAIAILTKVFTVLPQIITAGVILIIGYIIGNYVARLITRILTSINFNNLPFWLGLPIPQSRIENSPKIKTPSEIVGIAAMISIILFSIVTAIDILNITALTGLIQGLTIIFGSVLAGLLVLAIGLYFANLAFNLIITSGIPQARIVAQTARVTIIAFVATMALQQIGIATDIVNLAFGLSLGAISVSIALAIGLGTREIAAQQVRQWLDNFPMD